MAKKCLECGSFLNQYHLGELCWPCKEKKLEQVAPGSELLDAEDLAEILLLKNAESVKRAARQGRIPPRVPGIKKCLWHRSVIEAWIKSAGELAPSLAEALAVAQGLGWDTQSLTDYGTNPQKLIEVVARFRKSPDHRGLL